MHFEVHLTHPFGGGFQLLAVFIKALLRPGKIFSRGSDLCFRHTGKSALKTFIIFHHLKGGSAAAVRKAKGQKDFIMKRLILEPLPIAIDVIGRQLGGIRIFKRRKHTASVDPLPNKEIVGHGVGFVPCHFGGEESIDAALFHDLRQGAGISEHIRQP